MMTTATSSPRPALLMSVLALLIGVATLALAVWIFIPAPTYFLLTFSVGAPEVSPFLIVSACVAIALASPALGTSTVARLGAVAATLALIIAITPLARSFAVRKLFDAEMTAAIGPSPLTYATPATVAAMRRSPIAVRDLFLGVPIGPAKITRGVAVASPDGVPLTVDIYQPVTKGRYPILVQIYGGAWQRGEPGAFAHFAQWLASRGYVVFAIDYRHAPKSRWPAQLDDVHTMLAWIRDHASAYDADTSRVALMGRSAGAHLAMLAAWNDSTLRARAVVSYYGPVNLVAAYEHPPSPDPLSIREVQETLFGGTLAQLPDRYRTASPINNVKRSLPPTLLVYGRRDHIVEPEYGAALRDALRAQGNIAMHLEIPWADHAFDEVFQGPSSQLALYYTERFLAWALADR
jgi:acetyl esterase/lipase